MARQKYENPETPLNELMERWPSTIPVFLRHKMLCVGCQVSPFHTVADACMEHAVDEDDFLHALRDAITQAGRH